MPLKRAWIEAHIPHQGRMCLLDEVLEWGPEHIRCSCTGHRAPDHPLRAHGRLGAACGIELAAQAMAIHGALTAPDSAPVPAIVPASAAAARSAPAAGFLASVRSVRLFVVRLDEVPGNLICDAVRIGAHEGSALYEFELHSTTMSLLNGRATVVFDAQGRLAP